MGGNIIFNKDIEGDIIKSSSKDNTFEYKTKVSMYNVKEIRIFDETGILVKFRSKKLFHGGLQGVGDIIKGIKIPHKITVKRRVDFNLKRSFLVSIGKDVDGILLAYLYIPREQLKNFKVEDEIVETENVNFTNTYVTFNGLRFMVSSYFKFDVKKVKQEINKQLECFNKKVRKGKTIGDLKEVVENYKFKL